MASLASMYFPSPSTLPSLLLLLALGVLVPREAKTEVFSPANEFYKRLPRCAPERVVTGKTRNKSYFPSVVVWKKMMPKGSGTIRRCGLVWQVCHCAEALKSFLHKLPSV